jgi:hypothetical protein
MFRNSIGPVSTLLFGILVFGASTVGAGELQEVINQRSNYTSRPYFNLNTHEKASPVFFGGEIPQDEPSIFTDEYSDFTIHYVKHEKSTVTDRAVMESYTGRFKVIPDEKPAKVVLSCEKEAVHVLPEVPSKPDKEENGRGSGSILWYQYSVFVACYDTDPPVPDSPVYPDFPVYIESPDTFRVTPGPIHVRDVYDFISEEFIKHETETSTGKETVKLPDITRLFKWLGWFCQADIFDTDSDGNADAYGFTFVKTY